MPGTDAHMNPYDQIDSLAMAPVLLIASDYDGTLSPIVHDPAKAFPEPEMMVALKALAAMPQTHVSIISGRSLRDLATFTGSPSNVHLVGSHGSEFEPGFGDQLGPEVLERLDRVTSEVQAIVDDTPGTQLERKPASIAFHYRQMEGDPSAAVDAVMSGPATLEGVYTKTGKKVIEFSVVATDKGVALERIRSRVGATVCVYIGDDVTDEDAFKTMSGPDVSIKVGDEETAAVYRVRNIHGVARFLAQLTEERARWLAGAQATPIEGHSCLSDQRTCALVNGHGAINWFCAPRLDSPAIFADLLGGPTAGYFQITESGVTTPTAQAYDDNTKILRTEWSTFSVVDYLDVSGGRPLQRAGRTDLVRVLEGSGSAEIVFAPRLEFGRTATRLIVRDNGLEVDDGADPCVLYSPGIHWTIEREGKHDTARAAVALDASALVLELRYGTGDLSAPRINEAQRRKQTRDYWSNWVDQLQLPEVEKELVTRSALTLKSLVYGPTGAFAAAATTSLPEHLGGIRNWDYRYCWLRDGAMSAEALVELGVSSEAMQFLDWVLNVLDDCVAPEQLRPVYTLAGNELGTEGEIAELSGYRGSRPVRVGNAASRQLQLDVFGPLVQLIYVLLERGAPLSTEHWRLVEAMVCAVQRRWQEPDHGIWEIRGPRRHYVHSKTMCWLAVDRAIRVAERFLGGSAPEWIALRDEIASDVLENGFKPEVGTFAAAYDGTDLDASVLYVGMTGLVAPDDPRFVGTVRAMDRYLRDGASVYRYRFDDGLPGAEGGFHICTTWLIESLLLIGDVDAADELFQDYVALAGPTGLLPEEFDTKLQVSLGNHPQAYSHLGLIRCARRLEMARTGTAAQFAPETH
ncbi:MAG: trehalose-phosphatase [Planctomycetota bacterium]